jgi:alanine racemase
MHRVEASIDLCALAHNFAIAKARAGGGRVVAVIKANAYGHGLVPVAEALQEADLYGVTDIEEAELLRAGGTDKDILILQGLIARNDVSRIARQGFQVVIHRPEHLHWLEEELDKYPPRKPLVFWLKLDSGMGRLGLTPLEYSALWRKLKNKTFTQDVIMATHLANSSQYGVPLTTFRNAFKVILGSGRPVSSITTEQLMIFTGIRKQLEDEAPLTSVASSSGILTEEYQGDFVRPGIMLYGSSPFRWTDREKRREKFGLHTVMTLRARLISVKQHKASDSIGYNSQFICPKDMRIGIVSIGYADGYPSNAPNGVPVSVCGKRAATVGRVSMDMLAIDLSEVPQATIGDPVTLWGTDVSLDEVAEHTGILSYNLTCSVAARVPRVYG